MSEQPHLPISEDEWEKSPRPVRLEPDVKDLYLASHIVLKSCPFCGENPVVLGEQNPVTKLFGYRVQCGNYHCFGNVFTCNETREGARERAIEQWSLRESDALKLALEESVKLQSHYASLLNDYDGGKRRQFANADAWVERLRETGTLKQQ